MATRRVDGVRKVRHRVTHGGLHRRLFKNGERGFGRTFTAIVRGDPSRFKTSIPQSLGHLGVLLLLLLLNDFLDVFVGALRQDDNVSSHGSPRRPGATLPLRQGPRQRVLVRLWRLREEGRLVVLVVGVVGPAFLYK